jgi:hypothetical protein
MGSRKGHTNNPNGRPKGSVSEKTKRWNEFGEQLFEYGLPRALKIMKTAKDRDFMFHFISLVEYFQAKLQRTEITGRDGQNLIPDIDLTKLTQVERDLLIATSKKLRSG